ncbi:MAG: hypothetical protein KAS75_00970 [Planctomycetes bacterium]|nr:hypothetical protein [Planctomycetota bacterium]MCK5602128.1 hypothetical protein [Candidatus Pacearchaeota archaeon]
MLKEILLILAGAISATFGGFFATLYQAKQARKIRREEIIGEKQVEICQQVATRIATLKSIPDQISLEEASKYVYENETWFWDNCLFLPSKFRNKWLSIRLNLKKAVRRVNQIYKLEEPSEKIEEELGKLEDGIAKMIDEAESIILQEFKLPKIEVEKIPLKKASNKT